MSKSIHQFSVLLLLLLLGVSTRLYPLDCSYGTDALASLQEARRFTSSTLVDYFTLSNLTSFSEASTASLAHHLERTMPGYYVLLKFALELGIDNDVLLRGLTAAVFGILLVLVLFILGRDERGFSGGVALSVLALFSPLLVYYSSYIRFYSLHVFLAALCYMVFLRAQRQVAHGKKLGVPTLVLLSILLWLPLFVHISALLIVLINFYLLVFFILPRLSRKHATSTAILCSLTAIPFLSNAAAHLLARATDGEAVDNVMSESAISFLASLYFNFNGLIFILIGVYLLFFRPSRERFLILYLPYLLVFTALFVAACIRSDLFRPDYVSSLLPVTYLLFVDAIFDMASSARKGREMVIVWVLLGLVVMHSLPSFVSNMAIDQDRFDYGAASKALMKASTDSENILIYAIGQDRFAPYEFEEGRFTFVNLHQWNEIDEHSYDKIFVVLPWRREGFSKQFSMVTRKNKSNLDSILQSSRLITVSGKSRLDLRDNFLFIFERDIRADTSRHVLQLKESR